MRPTDEVRAELEMLLAADQTRLGAVFRGDQRGLDRHQIAKEIGVTTSGFVSNNRTIVRAMLEGELPRGTQIAAVAGAVRQRLRLPILSSETSAHLAALVIELETRRANLPTSSPPPAVVAPAVVAPAGLERTDSLRQATDDAVRERLDVLTRQISAETGIGADDYRSALAARFTLDGIAYLLLRNTSSATTQALLGRGTPELTLEQAVLDWSIDLPIMLELISYASGRLRYWSG